MPQGKLKVTRSHLLRVLTDDPALPALIERMDAPTLKKLIDHIGLEDSGALMALARPDQIAGVLDEALWKNERPGGDEALSMEEFLRWLDVWHDIGDTFAAEQLHDLGEDFCATCFAQLLEVNGADVAPLGMDDFTGVFGGFVVRARFEDEWDTVLAALAGLWTDFPDFLLHILGRLAFRHGLLGEHDAAHVLHADTAGDREARRQQKGYVASSDAGAFLEGLRTPSLASLVEADGYDPLTVRYFRAIATPHRETAPTGEEPDDVEREAQVSEADLDAMHAELEKAEIVVDRRTRLLTGPEHRGADARLRRALAAQQQASPAAFAARMRELAYLSNALVVAASHRGGRFSEASAANAAMATCNLGVEYLSATKGRSALDTVLAEEPGLVRAFAIGFHLINRLPDSAAERLCALFRRDDVRHRLDVKRWVIAEVDALLAEPDLKDVVRERRWDEAKETITLLSIALAPHACAGLRVVIDGYPSFPRWLEGDTPNAHIVTDDARFIDSLDDLRSIDGFLEGLSELVRL